MTTRRSLMINPLDAASPDIGRFLWVMEDIRTVTKRVVAGIDPTVLDWAPSPALNSIGTLLAHIAIVEADWLYTEVLEQDFPPEIAALLPPTSRDPDGHLTRVHGRAVAEHLAVLDAVRARLLAVFLPMSPAEYRRVRHLPDYDVTPEWCLYHLAEHEAAHRGEIETVRTLAEAAIMGDGATKSP
jgi:uncharacterized damage-inducible protein DinB